MLAPLRATVALALAAGVAAYTPSFLWSEKLDAGFGSNAQYLHEATAAELEHTVRAVQSGRGAPPHSLPLLQRAAEGRPEVHLVFLADGLRTEHVRQSGHLLPNVQRLLETSSSSVSVPFTSEGRPFGAEGGEGGARVAAHEAEEYIAANIHLLSNGQPDLLLIEIAPAPLAEQDALVGRIAGIVSEATGGNYAALLTGRDAGARRQLLGSAGRVGAAAGRPKLRIDRHLLTGLLISLLLFIIFISGFCCLFSLQTPKRFEAPKQHEN